MNLFALTRLLALALTLVASAALLGLRSTPDRWLANLLLTTGLIDGGDGAGGWPSTEEVEAKLRAAQQNHQPCRAVALDWVTGRISLREAEARLRSLALRPPPGMPPCTEPFYNSVLFYAESWVIKDPAAWARLRARFERELAAITAEERGGVATSPTVRGVPGSRPDTGEATTGATE